MHLSNNRLMRSIVFLGIFLATLEVAARIDQWAVYGAPVLGVYTYDTALFTTDEFGVRGKANGSYEKWQLNAFGFRGPEVQLVKNPGQVRIVCVGASETFGLYESRGKEWPRQLEERLRQSGIDAEVINGALAGISLPNRTRHLEKRLLQFGPDVVVFMLEYGSYAGVTPERVQARRQLPPIFPQHNGVVAGLLSLRVISQLREALVPRLPDSAQEMMQSLERKLKLSMVQRELGLKYRSLNRLMPFEVFVFKEDLKTLVALANSTPVKLVLVSPAMWFTDRNLATTYLSWPYIDEAWWKAAAVVLPRMAQEFAEANNIEFLDLSALVEGQEAIYMKDMLHFNDSGAARVAQHVEQVLLEPRAGLAARQ